MLSMSNPCGVVSAVAAQPDLPGRAFSPARHAFHRMSKTPGFTPPHSEPIGTNFRLALPSKPSLVLRVRPDHPGRAFSPARHAFHRMSKTPGFTH